ncbi:MAG: folylpolyglutamate synthase/dihydrofolate synthase family protein [Desulfobacterales bacterium]
MKPLYQEILDEMFGLCRFGIILGLDTTRRILAALGNPQDRFTALHVAGTNGKGSIASALAAILERAGYRVGLYTSPHLVRFNERIQINGSPIEDSAVVAAYQRVKKVAEGEREPTFFEYTTAMAFSEFARQEVDWAVVETGMGGRMDATNVLSPAATIITNISLEHQAYLGRTLSAIAYEKAGIIKSNVPLITGVAQPQARKVIHETAARQKAPLYQYGKDFRVRRRTDGSFNYYGIAHRWPGLRTALDGPHQVQNAALVAATCESLMGSGCRLKPQVIREGLAHHVWPGRLEKVCDTPLVILDGAHNRAAARQLGQYLKTQLSGRKITLVVGILDDKPYRYMLSQWLPLCGRVIVTRPVIDRALPPETLASVAEEYPSQIEIIPSVAAAVRRAYQTSAPQDAICIAGSLYVVGEARDELSRWDGISLSA